MSLYDSEVASPSTSSTTTKKSPTSIASDTVLATRLKVCKLASNTKACSQLVEELELRLRIARNCQRVAEFHLERLKTTENHVNHVNYENHENHENHENSQLVAAQKLVDDAQRATNVWTAQVNYHTLHLEYLHFEERMARNSLNVQEWYLAQESRKK